MTSEGVTSGGAKDDEEDPYRGVGGTREAEPLPPPCLLAPDRVHEAWRDSATDSDRRPLQPPAAERVVGASEGKEEEEEEKEEEEEGGGTAAADTRSTPPAAPVLGLLLPLGLSFVL